MEVPVGRAQHRAMKRNLIGCTASTVLGLMLATAPAFSKSPVSDARLTVRLLDYVNLPAGTRSEVAASAKRILGQAGVAVEFVECYSGGVETGVPACNASLGPADLYLRIFQPKLAVKGGQLGYAAMTRESGAYITVFINPEQRKARAGSLDDGVLLGHAVAHEIGHLLLGANSHSSSGIMRPAWRPIDEEWMAKGVLVFDGSQARKMRATLLARSGR
jgi:hypothetical protein